LPDGTQCRRTEPCIGTAMVQCVSPLASRSLSQLDEVIPPTWVKGSGQPNCHCLKASLTNFVELVPSDLGAFVASLTAVSILKSEPLQVEAP
jgi:hypothetical protein